jgi:DNA-binding phage protein
MSKQPECATSYDAWLHQRLRDPERAARYLAEHATDKEQDPELYALALRDIEAARKLNEKATGQ